MSELLEINGLTKRFGNKVALNNVSLKVERGHIIGLLGPNGSGKTTFIKMLNGLLTPTSGTVLVNGNLVGIESKKVISYLPDVNYLNMNQKVSELIKTFKMFYADFDSEKAYGMLEKLGISASDSLKSMSKGTKEKVQLILVMSRNADLYVLDEPIAGVDPAARDYILNLIISNYNPESTIIISTHLIADIEKILDQVIFLKNGNLERFSSVEDIREKEGMSVDAIFREVYKC